MPAVIFDLDETLLDTHTLRDVRKPGRWGELARRLTEAQPYEHPESTVQAAQLPARVKTMGFDVGVLTHSPRWYAERMLAEFSIDVDALITGSDGYAPKPDPSSLGAVAKEIGVPIADCIMVGDDVVDIAAAQNAGATSIGVAWSGHAPHGWRRRWPDIAVAKPDRLIDALKSPGPRFPFAEAMLNGDKPLWHWGSLLRVGDDLCGAGHYYRTADRRHPTDRLSRLIIEAKQDEQAAKRVGTLFAELVAARWKRAPLDVITSVPPKPDETYDRFAPARAAVAAVSGAKADGDVLRQCFDDPGYKHQQADERLARTHGRFASTTMHGERVLLIDDVVTSGGQVEECRRQMLSQGAGSVEIVVLGVTQDPLLRSCPRCGGTLRLVTSGPYGPFIGCSNYYRSDCRYREPAPVV